MIIQKAAGRIPKPFSKVSTKELQRANEMARRCWFSKGAKGFFESSWQEKAVVSKSGLYALFVSGEKGPSGPRKYTVRAMDLETGYIETVGEFMAYPNMRRAKRALEYALEEM